LLVGAFLGIGILGRPHIALIAAAVGLGCAWSRRSAKPAIYVAVSALAGMCALAICNRWMFGEWSLIPAGYTGHVSAAVHGFNSDEAGYGIHTPMLINILGFLVSPGRGVLIWTPAVMLFMVAIVRAWKDAPDWSKWLLLGGVLYSVLQLRLNHFAGGEGFYSYRHGLELLTCLVPIMTFSVRRLGVVARWLLPPVIGAQVAAISIGAINESYFVPMDQMWTENSFMLALRFQPGLVGVWLGLCVVIGVLVSVLINKPRSRS
jgi:hypothetical protein